MRIMLALGGALFLGGVAAACLFWAGVSQGAPIAFTLGDLALVTVIPLAIGQMGNWGVPGDVPPFNWRRRH